jgi:hypothetical protein
MDMDPGPNTLDMNDTDFMTFLEANEGTRTTTDAEYCRYHALSNPTSFLSVMQQAPPSSLSVEEFENPEDPELKRLIEEDLELEGGAENDNPHIAFNIGELNDRDVPEVAHVGSLEQRFIHYKACATGASLVGADAAPLPDVLAATYGSGRAYSFFVPRAIVRENPNIGHFDRSHALGEVATVLFTVWSEICSKDGLRLGLPPDYGKDNAVKGCEPPPDAKKKMTKPLVPLTFAYGDKLLPHAVMTIEAVFVSPADEKDAVRFVIGSKDYNTARISKFPGHRELIGYSFAVVQMNPSWSFSTAFSKMIDMLETAQGLVGTRNAVNMQGNAQEVQTSRRVAKVARSASAKNIQIRRFNLPRLINQYAEMCALDVSLVAVSKELDVYLPSDYAVGGSALNTVFSIESEMHLRAYAARLHFEPSVTARPGDMKPADIKHYLQSVWPFQNDPQQYLIKPENRNVRAISHTMSVLPLTLLDSEHFGTTELPWFDDPDADALDPKRRMEKQRASLANGADATDASTSSFHDNTLLAGLERFVLWKFYRSTLSDAVAWHNRIEKMRTTLRQYREDHETFIRENAHTKFLTDKPLSDFKMRHKKFSHFSELRNGVLAETPDSINTIALALSQNALMKERLLKDSTTKEPPGNVLANYIGDLMRKYEAGYFDDPEGRLAQLEEAIAAEEKAIDTVLGDKRAWDCRKLEEMLALMRLEEGGAVGPKAYADHYDRLKAACADRKYGEAGFRNGTYYHGPISPDQSWFQNTIWRCIGRIDKFAGRVNSHMVIIQLLAVFSHCAVLTINGERFVFYLGGMPGAGKSAAIDFLASAAVSSEPVGHMTPQSIATLDICHMQVRLYGEISPLMAGMEPGRQPNPQWKEMLSSGVITVKEFHQEEGTGKRTTVTTVAIQNVEHVIAGNIPFKAMPKEITDRMTHIHVSSVMQHPEAPNSFLKNDTVARDKEANDKFFEKTRDANMWLGLFVLKDHMNIGNTKFNMDIVNRMINEFSNALSRYTGAATVMEARLRKMIVRTIKHWTMVNAIEWQLNGPGSLLSGKYKQAPSLSWLLDLEEMAHNPTEEIVIFVLGLCIGNILDTRLSRILSNIFPACGIIEPLDRNDLSKRRPADVPDTQYRTDDKRVDYHYTKISMRYTAVIVKLADRLTSHFTPDEISHVINAESVVNEIARVRHTGNDDEYIPVKTPIYVPRWDNNGKPVFTEDPTTKEVVRAYTSLPPIVVNKKSSETYVLTHLFADPYAEAFEKAIHATCNAYTIARPYKVAVGRVYTDPVTNIAYPNAFETIAVQRVERTSLAFDPYKPVQRTVISDYQYDPTMFFEKSMLDDPKIWKSKFSPVNTVQLSEHQSMKRFNEATMSPIKFKNSVCISYWENQVEVMQKAIRDPGFKDMHLTMSGYIYAPLTKDANGLTDIGAWVIQDINKARSAFQAAQKGLDMTDPEVKEMTEQAIIAEAAEVADERAIVGPHMMEDHHDEGTARRTHFTVSSIKDVIDVKFGPKTVKVVQPRVDHDFEVDRDAAAVPAGEEYDAVVPGSKRRHASDRHEHTTKRQISEHASFIDPAELGALLNQSEVRNFAPPPPPKLDEYGDDDADEGEQHRRRHLPRDHLQQSMDEDYADPTMIY